MNNWHYNKELFTLLVIWSVLW